MYLTEHQSKNFKQRQKMVESRLWSNSICSSSPNPREEEEEEEESDISNVLPLQLTRSYPIPPAPNRSRASIDWLQDFGGFSWIAYGASSLLIISHFPSPLSPQQTSVGPVFRQVIEPPCGGAGPALVKAVAWSPSHPSNGDIAVASENRICLYSAERGNMAASFHWRQISGLVQYSAVEAIKWTGSGDGLIAAGIEVVLWKNKNKVWEVVWKTTAELPQSLVSATWSIEGPSATAAHAFHDSNLLHDQPSFLSREASRCVLIYHNDGKYGFVKHELCHPQPVTMVQWRPPTATSLTNNSSHSRRDVLLTCCLDGTVRLWCEIDSGRARKSVKDAIDQKATRRSFHVAAVIEIQQSLKGNLGIDTFVTWPVEVKDMSGRSEGLEQCCSTEVSDYDMVGRCEWLIGVGPEFSCTFWAIHCLDDTSPLRFPRITLWKKQDLRDFQAGHLCNTGNTDSKSQPILVQAVILRSQPFGPPTICSLLQLMPDNSIYWSNLHDSTLSNAEDGSSNKPSKENILSCCSSGFLNQGGHTGKILQVAVHPYNCEVELAVSLDSNGSLLFWSLPTMNCILGQPTLALPTWKLLGRIDTREFSTNVEYSVLRWAPSVFNEKHLLFMGHTGGVDCFVIIISESEGEKIICRKICTIPFPSHSHGHGPDHICTISLPSTCSQSLVSNSFMLLTIWMEGFLVLSWKVVLHFDDICGSNCGCSFNARNDATSEAQRYKYAFDGRQCCVVVEPCSSKFPDPGNHDQVTSVATVSPDNWVPSVQKKWPSSCVMCSYTSVYQMATGCSDGSVKLWRIHQEELSTSHSELISLPWELVGVFIAHQGPISAISLSGCGSKIATIGNEGQGSANALHIWESVYLTGVGNFSLEDSIPLDGSVTAMQWLSVGNGQLLLGVCLKNELRVYAKKRCNGPIQVKLGKAVETHLWSCIALGHTLIASQDFLWGPRSIPILVHDAYFRLFGLWSYKDSKNLSHSCQKPTIDCPDHFIGEMDEDIFCAVYNDSNMFNLKESATDEKGEGCKSLPSVNIKIKNGHGFCNFCLKISQQQDFCTNSRPYSMLETLEKFCGSLPIYHPETLFLCLCSGNWKRAYVAVRHLVEYLNSVDTSDKGVKDNNLRKFCSAVPQIQLSQYFGEFYLKSVRHEGLQWGGEISSKISGSQFCRDLFQHEDVNSVSGNMLGVTSGNSEISGFIKALEKPCDVKALTSMERTQILAMVDLLGEVSDSCHSSAYESFDEPGRRFWVAVRFQQLYFLRKFGKLAAEELVVDSGLIAWAFHSDCHDSLFSSLVPNEPSWLQMQRLGVGYWFTNAAGLRMKMEKLARSQYLKKKDPKDCALLYLALNRLQVLTGLFKISKDEKDRPLVGFLSRNFQEEKNKAAALKNAYVLMGKHQLELAIAFFLLGGDPSSAVTVCAKNLGDEQLALVICRLIEGYGGPLEHHIISSFLLPSAIEKKDYWLASVFEWVLGNYSQSFQKLVSFRRACTIDKVVIPCNHALSSDPSIGQYCALLSSKSTMKNSVGEYTAGVLSRWAAWMTATALNQCGLPLEALECLSTSLGTPEGKDQLSLSDIGKLRTVNEIFQHDAMNWLLGDVAYYLESFAEMNLAMQYISKLLMEHPNWPDTHLADSSSPVCDKANQFEPLLEKFEDKLNAGVALFEQRYSLEPARLLNMILIFSCNNGLLFLGYCILHGYTSQEHLCHQQHNDDNFILYPALLKMLLNAGEEVSVLLARYIVASSIPCSTLKSSTLAGNAFCEDSLGCFRGWDFCLREVTYTFESFRFLLKLYGSKFLPEDFTVKTFTVLDLLEYCTYFASAWSERNSKVLFLLIRPILTASAPSGMKTVDLKKILYQTMDIMLNDTSNDHEGNVPATDSGQWQHGQIDPNMLAVPEDERWQLIGACLWKQLSNLSSDLLNTSITDSGDDYSSSLPHCGDASLPSNSTRCQSDMIEPIKLFPLLLAKLLKTTLAYISSSLSKQLVSFLRLKVENGLPVPTLVLLEESRHAQPRTSHNFLKQESDAMKFNNQNGMSFFEMLWEISFDPGKVCESIVLEKNNIFDFIGQNLSRSWTYMHKGIMADDENIHTIDHGVNRGSFTTEASSAARNQHSDSSIFHGSGRRDSGLIKSFTCFQNRKEIFKKNGELLEALCVNSLDRRQAALASNRKGLIFFDSKVEEPFRESADYIWSEADWPRNGWAGSESTPIPTFVSPGIGLGSKKGAHLGLGGATIGRGSLARPGKDLTGGGAFGIPGYAGVGASGFGWGEQEGFEEFVDPPATVENISTRTLSSHPSRPFFLVGSSNTHIYLWEFGRDRASATYGVLPAANVPPPYALASISALQFDCCGHRFASAALDGTVCTWQLEVGGRSNVCPTESSLCFNGHASDLAYVTASGSILAVAGYSPNGINLVIWDTLAPPATSQASIICHEGGARSLSVFDNDLGSGSISPLIVTGGKGGDVGLHDFRYIATGRSKRNRHSTEQSMKSPMHDMYSGASSKFVEQNRNGMLWHIPRAHQGSVTRISTIPNTSLFLTGSKDGDVKLWDARGSEVELVFHWQKMHERHTFLQPNSRGFGGVVRAAVTDIQVLPYGFLTCGGDGSVKMVQLKDIQRRI